MLVEYFIEFDKTGFPLIGRSDWNYSISLFPVSKYQFERFMIEEGPKGSLYTDAWYRELLEKNPRASWKNWMNGHEKPWKLFLTGANPNEITPFLRYLGKNFRLPTKEQRLELLKSSDEIQQINRQELESLCKNKAAPPVALWIEKGLFPLVREGLLEIVKTDINYQYIGRPWQGLHNQTWRPEDVRDVNWELSRFMVGFRVVKNG